MRSLYLFTSQLYSSKIKCTKQHSKQQVAPAAKLTDTSVEALPGLSLSAVQYSTVRKTIDRVGLSHTDRHHSAGQLSAPHHAERHDTHNGHYSF